MVGRRLHALGLLWVHLVTRSNNRASTRSPHPNCLLLLPSQATVTLGPPQALPKLLKAHLSQIFCFEIFFVKIEPLPSVAFMARQ